ncbi:sigma-54-dependent transcriptional regulator [Tunicatimonas pelagia]|uniref:sigma-54-dependent transcriptional regulator n=1 Tax=Tunicatimonas pelagia TaxID=931531 RepID=UPI0026658A15|nr:sigma-54 dependent transcriptional regulator [Tunicatimonas pelagia]WKN43627.1 sigma-54 dependent transcriptional regulator [Tunicatimonas pelagia]
MDKQAGNILIVDDDQAVLYTAKLILKQHFTHVQTEGSPSQITTHLQKQPYDVLLLDMNFASGKTSGEEGLYWIKQVRELTPKVQIIVTTAYGDIELAVKAMKEGAVDFLTKPWEKEKLVATVASVCQLSHSKGEVEKLKKQQQALSYDLDSTFSDIVSESEAMRPVFETIEKVAQTDANVLILGENGTGKELVARAIHRASLRSVQPFIKVDLGTISETLFEAELFGHSKGAFTGAVEAQAGRFEVASGGTLFLDEIGNLSPALQAKLLTAIQSKEVIRVGTNQPIPVDIRLLSATNQPIYALSEGNAPQFRQDLLYRINTVEVSIPSLRERPEDIPLLVNHYLQVYGKKYHKQFDSLRSLVISALQRYAWPGNVRELQHAVERAVIMSNSTSLEASDLLVDSQRKKALSPTTNSLNMDEVEKRAIQEAIRKHQGNLSKAAEELGLGRSTLYRKMKKYGV